MFSNIPKIFCICTQERQDRYNECIEEFNKLKIDNYEFYRPNKINDGRLGCFQSHMNVIEKIINENLDYALILEDDFHFINDLSEIDKCISFINFHDKKENILIKLGGINLIKRKYNSEFLYKSKSILAHSYFINYSYATVIHNNYINDIVNKNIHTNKNVDLYLAKKYEHFYILKNQICIQRKSKSDNKWDNIVNCQNITDTSMWYYIQQSNTLRYLFGKFIYIVYF